MINFNPTGKYRKNFNQAEKYFKIAADVGMAEAQYKLGWIYRFGLSGDQNLVEAAYYLEKAAEQGHIGALGSLVLVYQMPGNINYHKAFQYAKKAANMGDAASAYRVANFYFLGRGCNVDTNKAYEYYKFAYEHGVYRAKIMMDKIRISEEK
jgi:TPR repeat protein